MIVQLQISRRFILSSTDHPSCYVPGPGRVTPSCSVSAWPRWLGHGDCDISAAVETFFRICSPQCEMTPAEIRTLRVRWKWRTWQKCSPTGLCLSSGKLVNVVGSAVTNIRSDLCVIVTYSKTWLLHPACTIVFLLPLCQCECPNQTLCRVPWAERRAGVRLPENGAGLSGVRAPLPLPSTHSRHLGCRALYSRNIQHKLQCEKKRDFVKFSAEKCNEASAPVLKSPFPRFGCHLVQVGCCWGDRTQVSQFCFV